MQPTDYLGKGSMEGLEVKVIIRPLTKEESQKIFHHRPFSNFAESRFGGDRHATDAELVALGKGRPCRMCQAVTHNEILLYGTCPDCDGRSETSGKDPHRPIPLEELPGGPRRGGHVSHKKCCGGKHCSSK